MVRSVSTEHYAAQKKRALIARDFLWIVARDRVSGVPVPDAYWSDRGPITCQVVDPDNGTAVTRTFQSGRGLVSIPDIPHVSNLTVQRVPIKLSQASERVNQLLRQYDVQQAKVEVFRGHFHPVTRKMVAPAEPRFVGFVDEVMIVNGPENQEGSVTLNCVSHTQELMRSNSDTRSDASQRLRNPIDNFYQDTGVVGDWEMFWGKASGPVPSQQDLLMKGARGLFR